MTGIERILVAVDLLRPSKPAVDHGVSLALRFNAKLRLAYIIPSSRALVYSPPSESYAFTREVAYANATLQLLVPREYRRLVELEVIVKVGDVRSELGNIVNDEKIDLVVMGASRRHRVGRLLLGSLSERIQNTTPVLTVPRVNASEELHPLGRIPVHHVLYA